MARIHAAAATPDEDGGLTELHMASDEGDTERVTSLLASGADVNAMAMAGWTPLHLAIRRGRADAVQALLAAGADAARVVHGRDALELAEHHDQARIADMLRRANANHEQRGLAQQTVRVLGATVRSGWLLPIWALEALNYHVHVIWRDPPWNPVSVAAGYLLWSLQLMCFFRCQLQPTLQIPESWHADATAGHAPCTVCPKTGQLIPPRSRYMPRFKLTILGFDHHCFWIGIWGPHPTAIRLLYPPAPNLLRTCSGLDAHVWHACARVGSR
jgi:hypothetical protein